MMSHLSSLDRDSVGALCASLCIYLNLFHKYMFVSLFSLSIKRADDSHEFLRMLIDQLCNDFKDPAGCRENQICEAMESEVEEMSLREKADYWWKRHLAHNSSFITDVFGGQLVSTVQCTACKANSYCFDPFYDISLPFPEGGQQRRRSSMLSILGSPELPRCSIDDCLRQFCKDEVLEGTNMPECCKCGGKRESIKRLQVFRVRQINEREEISHALVGMAPSKLLLCSFQMCVHLLTTYSHSSFAILSSFHECWCSISRDLVTLEKK